MDNLRTNGLTGWTHIARQCYQSSDTTFLDYDHSSRTRIYCKTSVFTSHSFIQLFIYSINSHEHFRMPCMCCVKLCGKENSNIQPLCSMTYGMVGKTSHKEESKRCVREFPLGCNRIGGLSEGLGSRFNPRPGIMG